MIRSFCRPIDTFHLTFSNCRFCLCAQQRAWHDLIMSIYHMRRWLLTSTKLHNKNPSWVFAKCKWLLINTTWHSTCHLQPTHKFPSRHIGTGVKLQTYVVVSYTIWAWLKGKETIYAYRIMYGYSIKFLSNHLNTCWQILVNMITIMLTQ